jgi:hypothetical protein
MEGFDLNKLRGGGEGGDDFKKDGEAKKLTYADYMAMPPEELAVIAAENDTTPEKFLRNIKMLEETRKRG